MGTPMIEFNCAKCFENKLNKFHLLFVIIKMEKSNSSCPTVKQYVYFILSNIILYFIYYLTAKEWNWELRIKSDTEHYENITNLLVLSTALFFVGNYGPRWDTEMFAIALVSMFGFGYLAEMPFLKTHVSVGTVQRWNKKQRLFFFSVLMIIVMFAVYHFYEAYYEGILPLYTISLIGILGIAYGIPYMLSDNKHSLHFHHFLLFYIMALFTRFDTILGKMAAAICLGIFIQGSAMYDNRMFISTFLS
jgi:hypothetical protein